MKTHIRFGFAIGLALLSCPAAFSQGSLSEKGLAVCSRALELQTLNLSPQQIRGHLATLFLLDYPIFKSRRFFSIVTDVIPLVEQEQLRQKLRQVPQTQKDFLAHKHDDFGFGIRARSESIWSKIVAVFVSASGQKELSGFDLSRRDREDFRYLIAMIDEQPLVRNQVIELIGAVVWDALEFSIELEKANQHHDRAAAAWRVAREKHTVSSVFLPIGSALSLIAAQYAGESAQWALQSLSALLIGPHVYYLGVPFYGERLKQGWNRFQAMLERKTLGWKLDRFFDRFRASNVQLREPSLKNPTAAELEEFDSDLRALVLRATLSSASASQVFYDNPKWSQWVALPNEPSADELWTILVELKKQVYFLDQKRVTAAGLREMIDRHLKFLDRVKLPRSGDVAEARRLLSMTRSRLMVLQSTLARLEQTIHDELAALSEPYQRLSALHSDLKSRRKPSQAEVSRRALLLRDSLDQLRARYAPPGADNRFY